MERQTEFNPSVSDSCGVSLIKPGSLQYTSAYRRASPDYSNTGLKENYTGLKENIVE